MRKNYSCAYFNNSILDMIMWGYILSSDKVSFWLMKKCRHYNKKLLWLKKKNISFRAKIITYNCLIKYLCDFYYLIIAFLDCIGIVVFKFVANCHVHFTLIEKIDVEGTSLTFNCHINPVHTQSDLILGHQLCLLFYPTGYHLTSKYFWKFLLLVVSLFFLLMVLLFWNLYRVHEFEFKTQFVHGFFWKFGALPNVT